jgi:hypothetical protein
MYKCMMHSTEYILETYHKGHILSYEISHIKQPELSEINTAYIFGDMSAKHVCHKAKSDFMKKYKIPIEEGCYVGYRIIIKPGIVAATQLEWDEVIQKSEEE